MHSLQFFIHLDLFVFFIRLDVLDAVFYFLLDLALQPVCVPRFPLLQLLDERGLLVVSGGQTLQPLLQEHK